MFAQAVVSVQLELTIPKLLLHNLNVKFVAGILAGLLYLARIAAKRLK